MDSAISFTLNGKPCTVRTSPERPLLEVLREEFGLTGTKYGCGEGICRACTVILNGEAVSSCTTPVSRIENGKVQTIEGLSSSARLHPVQEAFLTQAGFQCGYCTPGMIMGLVALLESKRKPSETELILGMQRHLCRCCNYPALGRAIAASCQNAPSK